MSVTQEEDTSKSLKIGRDRVSSKDYRHHMSTWLRIKNTQSKF